MPRYVLSVVRVSEYLVEAAQPDQAWDAYIEMPEVSESYQDTLGHYVHAQDPEHDAYPAPVGRCLDSSGDFVPATEIA